MANSQEVWLQTDEAEDVAGAIRHALNSFSLAEQDPQAWKWVLLSLHSAIQGACVCHLLTTAHPVGAVTRKNAVEWLEYLEKSRSDPNKPIPKTQLMSLPELLKAVRKSP